VSSDDTHDTDLHEHDPVSAAVDALEDARARVASTPAEVIIVNHAMGLYELAAIHLSSQPPQLHQASLAIDALGALVDTLGERLGDQTATLREAISTLRMAYVQVSAG
jgi:hypothetical protein